MKPVLNAIRPRMIWDSRGHPTIEVEVALSDGAVGRGIAPAGASRGAFEAVDLRDGGTRFGGKGVTRALAGIRDEIAPRLIGHDARDQAGINAAMIALDGTATKSRLSGNAIVAVSLAVLQANAASAAIPLWQWVAEGGPASLPMPEIQIFGGGAHAGRRVDVQDFMVVPIGAESVGQALEWVGEVYHAAGTLMTEAGLLQGVADEGGFWPAFDSNEAALDMLARAIDRSGHRPGDEIAISLDVAASELFTGGLYRLGLEDRTLESGGMVELIAGWCDRYPIVSIEDPLDEGDRDGLAAFTARLGGRIQVVGDDHLVTNARRLRQAASDRTVNAVLVKPNQAGTITETAATMQAARAAGFGTLVSARSGETEDTAIAHLATGWNARQIKVGSFARSERMAKWNELIRIETGMGAECRFAGVEGLQQRP